MSKTQVILVGGFLGAGKTTLLAAATERLVRRGKRVGLITNDQAANLVDTAILTEVSDAVREVAGGCFCCRFDELTAAMEQLIEAGTPDVLIGEPVGSCTDLSATVLQPLKQFHRDRFQVAPFSVMVDVKQVRTLQRLRKSMQDAQSPRFPENVMYIYEKQLEEADLIVLNKADLVSPEEAAEVAATLRREFTQAPVLTVSARRGDGLAAWLDQVLSGEGAGRTIAQVDYDEYADGEAALGWLNAEFLLTAESGIDCRAFCSDLLATVQRGMRTAEAELAHLKVHLAAGSQTLAGNLTGNDATPEFHGRVEGEPRKARLLINIRARIDPGPLRAIAERCLAEAAGTKLRTQVEELQCFAPSRPTPTHRFAGVV